MPTTKQPKSFLREERKACAFFVLLLLVLVTLFGRLSGKPREILREEIRAPFFGGAGNSFSVGFQGNQEQNEIHFGGSLEEEARASKFMTWTRKFGPGEINRVDGQHGFGFQIDSGWAFQPLQKIQIEMGQIDFKPAAGRFMPVCGGLHVSHFKTMGNHCCWYLQGNHQKPGFLNGSEKWIASIGTLADCLPKGCARSMCKRLRRGPYHLPLLGSLISPMKP